MNSPFTNNHDSKRKFGWIKPSASRWFWFVQNGQWQWGIISNKRHKLAPTTDLTMSFTITTNKTDPVELPNANITKVKCKDRLYIIPDLKDYKLQNRSEKWLNG